MNRLDALFQKKQSKILSIYLTAGFPRLNDTVMLCEELERAGVNLIEIGFPFSDPVADGPIIQASSCRALGNGMNLHVLFEQLSEIRKTVSLPILLMGYLNPVLQFGFPHFCESCRIAGIEGFILPDLPLEEYQEHYRGMAESSSLHSIFLISPSTSPDRAKLIDSLSTSFIYAVSSNAVTGGDLQLDEARETYLRALRDAHFSHPILVGFGIRDKGAFNKTCEYAAGGIIGTAFIAALKEEVDIKKLVNEFVGAIL